MGSAVAGRVVAVGGIGVRVGAVGVVVGVGVAVPAGRILGTATATSPMSKQPTNSPARNVPL